jgi:hypothetical protein
VISRCLFVDSAPDAIAPVEKFDTQEPDIQQMIASRELHQFGIRCQRQLAGSAQEFERLILEPAK